MSITSGNPRLEFAYVVVLGPMIAVMRRTVQVSMDVLVIVMRAMGGNEDDHR